MIMMNICPKCEKVILSDYKFCPRCGYSIYGKKGAEEPAHAVPAAAPVAAGEDTSKVLQFFNVAQTLTTADDIDLLLKKIGSAVEEILGAERSSIMLLDDTGENLYFKTATGEDILKKLKIPVGMGVAGWIAQNKKPDIVNDPYNDERFSPDTDKKTGFKTRSIVGAPMMVGDELVGIVEAINKTDGEFTKDDMNTLMGFAGLAAVSIVNTKLKTDQKNFFSNMLDFLIIGTEALSSPEPTKSGHAWEIAKYVPHIGRELGFDRDKIHLIHNAALMHDIGFLGLANPELIGLRIDRELDSNAKYRLHPIIGSEIVKGIKMMHDMGPYILYHHQFKDGSGFPENLPLDQITPEIEVISILEQYCIRKDKRALDPKKFSPAVYRAFDKVIH
ncbi:MAG: GAF domain-containing protein [Elusimicrobia bacterium]|nr:GAF domain-containing protein [Elusimicrobiota bacterium]